MCLQCTTESVWYGEFAPGWHLSQAVKSDEDWHAGEWGLIEVNDPSIIISVNLNLPENQDQFYQNLDIFREEILSPIPVGHRLYSALSKIHYPFAVKKLWLKHSAYSFDAMLYLYLCWFHQQNKEEQGRLTWKPAEQEAFLAT